MIPMMTQSHGSSCGKLNSSPQRKPAATLPGMDRSRLPTVASRHATGYVVVLVWCKSCHHQRPADLPALIAAGKATSS